MAVKPIRAGESTGGTYDSPADIVSALSSLSGSSRLDASSIKGISTNIATTSEVGTVKPDGSTVRIEADGTIKSTCHQNYVLVTSASYTVPAWGYIVDVDVSAQDVTIVLPQATSASKFQRMAIRRHEANNDHDITIIPASGDTIAGAALSVTMKKSEGGVELINLDGRVEALSNLAGADYDVVNVDGATTPAFNAEVGQLLLCDTDGGDIVVNIPPQTLYYGQGARITVKNTGLGTVQLNAPGGGSIDGVSEVFLVNQWDSVILVGFNANYTIIAKEVGEFVGATSLSTGVSGLVPTPAAGDEGKVLFGNGTWGDVAATSDPATDTDLGVVIVGEGLAVDTNGVVSVNTGTGLQIDEDGKVAVDEGGIDVTKTMNASLLVSGVYVGALNASSSLSTLSNAQRGNWWNVSAAVTISGTLFSVGDQLWCTTNTTGTPTDLTNFVRIAAADKPLATVTLSNFTASASIGTASATVDVANVIAIPQTTAGVTVSLVSPTNTSVSKNVIIANTGSVPFALSTGHVVTPGSFVQMVYVGGWRNDSAPVGPFNYQSSYSVGAKVTVGNIVCYANAAHTAGSAFSWANFTPMLPNDSSWSYVWRGVYANSTSYAVGNVFVGGSAIGNAFFRVTTAFTSTTTGVSELNAVGSLSSSVEILPYGCVRQNSAAGTFVGANATYAGRIGQVPAPAAGDQNKVLSGAGTWISASAASAMDYFGFYNTGYGSTPGGAFLNISANVISNMTYTTNSVTLKAGKTYSIGFSMQCANFLTSSAYVVAYMAISSTSAKIGAGTNYYPNTSTYADSSAGRVEFLYTPAADTTVGLFASYSGSTSLIAQVSMVIKQIA